MTTGHAKFAAPPFVLKVDGEESGTILSCMLVERHSPDFGSPSDGTKLAIVSVMPTFRERMESPRRSREQILEDLTGFPDDLRRLLFSAHVDDALYRPGSDGGWGIVEILPHLRDWEEIYLERARRIVEEENPDLPGVDDALWPIERDYRGQDPREVFDDFSDLRQEHIDLLLELPPEAWSRTGEHSLYGPMTLGWMEDYVCDHDSEHLDQAREVLAG